LFSIFSILIHSVIVKSEQRISIEYVHKYLPVISKFNNSTVSDIFQSNLRNFDNYIDVYKEVEKARVIFGVTKIDGFKIIQEIPEEYVSDNNKSQFIELISQVGIKTVIVVKNLLEQDLEKNNLELETIDNDLKNLDNQIVNLRFLSNDVVAVNEFELIERILNLNFNRANLIEDLENLDEKTISDFLHIPFDNIKNTIHKTSIIVFLIAGILIGFVISAIFLIFLEEYRNYKYSDPKSSL
tara:strand:- start:15 stop:737 length:723 start_codon:yes stop_codon:yes gene_type:complete